MDDLAGKITEILGNEEAMKKVFEVMNAVTGSEKKEEPPKPETSEKTGIDDIFGGLDPTLLIKAASAFSSMKTDTKDASLLRAVKPFLSEERQKRADDAIRVLALLSILPTLTESGLLKGVLG